MIHLHLNNKKNKANFNWILPLEMIHQHLALFLMKFNIRMVLTKNIYSNNFSYDEQFQF